MIRSRRSRKRSFFSTACIRSSILDSQRSTTSSARTAPRRSSVSCSARIPVWATKRFFSRFPMRLEEGLHGLGRPLDDVLERRDPLEEVLVEGDLLLRLPRLLDDADAREHEELRVAAGAELFVVRVLRARRPGRTSGCRRVARRSPARLLAEPARVHHPDEQRARPVARVAEALLEDPEDREAGVETDEVGELSGPIGWFMPSFMIPSIASLVATPSRSGLDRLVDHRHQDAVGDETRVVVAEDRRLAHPPGEVLDGRGGLVRGRDAPDHLDERP